MDGFNENQLKTICDKYNIKYKFFPQTNIVLLDTGLDEWMIKYVNKKDRPYCLYHKNKIKQIDKFHIQRWVKKLTHALDSVANHKKVLSSIYGSHNTYRKNRKIKNKRRNYCC